MHPGRLAWRGERRVVVLEQLSLAQLVSDSLPDAKWRIAFAPREGHHPDLPDLGLGVIEVAHHGAAQRWVLGQEAEGNHIVGFATPHGLGEDKHALRRSSRKAPEGLPQEMLHTSGAVVLFKELVGIDAVLGQVGEVQDDIPPIVVEHALTGFAELGERFHMPWPSMLILGLNAARASDLLALGSRTSVAI